MSMRRAFTLIELMVVVGIMAMLGLAATNGYAALQRGMAERGAVAAVNALLKSAKERAKVDRVPTAVFFYNKMLREATDDQSAIVVGEAVAVRRSGRVSLVRRNMIYDEFADLEHTFDVDLIGNMENRPGMKLWRFDDAPMSRMQYSVVADAVCRGSASIMIDSIVHEVEEDAYIEPDISDEVDVQGGLYYMQAYGFYKKSGTSKFEPSGGWATGDGYGLEFATIQLPHNFVFGSGGVPSRMEDIIEAKAVYFRPTSSGDGTVDVYFCLPTGGGVPQPHHKAGTASSKDNAQS